MRRLLLAAALAAASVARAQSVPLSLNDIAVEVRRASPAVRRAEAARATAAARGLSAAGRLLPAIGASASYQRNLRVRETFLPAVLLDPAAAPDALVPVRFGADHEWRLSLTATVPLFDPEAWLGAAGAASARGAAVADAEDAGLRALEAADIAAFDLLLADARLDLTTRSLERVAAILADARARRAAGLASDYDVLRLEVADRSLRSEHRRAGTARQAAARGLAVALGRAPTGELSVRGRLLPADAPGPAATGADAPARHQAGWDGPLDLSAAVEHRPDIRSARLRAVLDQRLARAARAALLPRVTVFGTFDLAAQQNGRLDFFGTGAAQRATALAAGVRVDLPLIGGAAAGRVSEAGAAARGSAMELADRRAVAEADAQARMEQLADASARLADQALTLDGARRGFAIASAAFAGGTGSRLEVMDAELALRQTEFGWAQAMRDYLVARVQAATALGRATDPTALDALLGGTRAIAGRGDPEPGR